MKRRISTGIMLTPLLIGMLTLAMNIQPVKASGTIFINSDGSVDPDTAPISTADNITYTFTDNIYDSIAVQRSNIVIDGAGYTLQGTGTTTGILLYQAHSITIRNMKIEAHYMGIVLYESCCNNIYGNKIINNYEGIWLEHSHNNNIYGNNITANINYGIRIDASIGYSSIYHNNFIDNTNHVYIYSVMVGQNVWDNGYPSGGNYWSDHVCTGNPSNGSQPYIIDASNIDHYPFQDPLGWLFPGDLNSDGIVSINDVVIAALAFGSEPGDPNWNPIADIRQDGIVNIIDLVIIGVNFGRKYPV